MHDPPRSTPPARPPAVVIGAVALAAILTALIVGFAAGGPVKPGLWEPGPAALSPETRIDAPGKRKAAAFSVAAERQPQVGDVVAFNLQLVTAAGDLPSPRYLRAELAGLDGAPVDAAAFRVSQTGAGQQQTVGHSSSILCSTSPLGDAVLSVEDVAGGSGAALLLYITPVYGEIGILSPVVSPDLLVGVPVVTALVFD